jgi:hypothetical protein
MIEGNASAESSPPLISDPPEGRATAPHGFLNLDIFGHKSPQPQFSFSCIVRRWHARALLPHAQ